MPPMMLEPDSPFYLALKLPAQISGNVWFKKAPLGKKQTLQIIGHKTTRSLASYDKDHLESEEHLSCQKVLTGDFINIF